MRADDKLAKGCIAAGQPVGQKILTLSPPSEVPLHVGGRDMNPIRYEIWANTSLRVNRISIDSAYLLMIQEIQREILVKNRKVYLSQRIGGFLRDALYKFTFYLLTYLCGAVVGDDPIQLE